MRFACLLSLLLIVGIACQHPASEEATSPASLVTTASGHADSAPMYAVGGIPLPPAKARIARGEYLVTIAGCNDCHTPWHMGPNGPEPDMTRMLSGHPEQLVMPTSTGLAGGPWLWAGAVTNTAFAGPWGVSYTANLTPDASGLAAWDEEMFIRAIRTGKHMGQSRPILPPMPWPMYRRMTDEDLKAVFAYLQSIPPIVNHVPEPVPPAEAGAIAGM